MGSNLKFSSREQISSTLLHEVSKTHKKLSPSVYLWDFFVAKLTSARKFRLLGLSLPCDSHDTFWIHGWTQPPSPLSTEFPHGSCNCFATSRTLWVHLHTIWQHSITARCQPILSNLNSILWKVQICKILHSPLLYKLNLILLNLKSVWANQMG